LGVSPVIGFPDSRFTCQLPAGTGLKQVVVADRGKAFSDGQTLVSYAIPQLFGVSGCPVQTGNITSDCLRTVATTITLSGRSFGLSGARVIVGGIDCPGVAHDAVTPHTLLRCQLQPGFGKQLAIIVFQDGGESTSESVYLSYKPCLPGTYVSGINCPDCPAGRFTFLTGQTACLDCAAGKYALSLGQSLCQLCPAGQAASAGSSVCTQCTPGRFAGL